MRKLKTLGSALVIALVLVTCADYVSFAATGKSLILGKANYANRATSLSRSTSGAALKLHTASSSNAPFATNAKGKVANLNADKLDGLDSSALVKHRTPITVLSAAPIPGRQVAVGSTATVVQALALTVPAECGTNTRHTYLVEHQAWWSGSNQVVELSLAVDSTAHQFGDGSSVVQPNTYANSSSSRIVVLTPGAHTLRLIADDYSGGSVTASDPALLATDLGYNCSGGATTTMRTTSARTLAGLR